MRVIKSKLVLVKITIYFKILAGYSTGIISSDSLEIDGKISCLFLTNEKTVFFKTF